MSKAKTKTTPAAEENTEASVQTARDMIDNGQTEAYAADWLTRQCPDLFEDIEAAKAAISQ